MEGAYDSIEECQNQCPYCGDSDVRPGSEDCDDGKHCEDGTSCTEDTDCTDNSSCIPRSNDGCSSDCYNEAICCQPGDPDTCQYVNNYIIGREGDEICQNMGLLNAGAFDSLGYCHNQCPQCGDGIIQPELNEHCDDSNTDNRDGCSSNCRHEAICCIVAPQRICDHFEAYGDESGDAICEYYDEWVYTTDHVLGAYDTIIQCLGACPVST